MTRGEKIKALYLDPKRDERMAGPDPEPALALLGYNTRTISGDTARLKLELLVQGEEPALAILPIYMSRSQCTELGNALLRLATLPHQTSRAAH